MPVKGPKSPDYACIKCGYLFSKSTLEKMLQRIARGDAIKSVTCPKCGSNNVGILTY
jgi:predicted RNA-binding Zn-ribbon protein involved in translation (DUF1610 family)